MIVVVVRTETQELVYDTDDVEAMEFNTPTDVIDVSQPGDTAVRREHGQHHLELKLSFKKGKSALWRDATDASVVGMVSE